MASSTEQFGICLASKEMESNEKERVIRVPINKEPWLKIKPEISFGNILHIIVLLGLVLTAWVKLADRQERTDEILSQHLTVTERLALQLEQVVERQAKVIQKLEDMDQRLAEDEQEFDLRSLAKRNR